MERVEESFPSSQRRPLVVARDEQASARPTAEVRAAQPSTADRLLIASSLLLVVSAAGLATGSRFEPIFLGVFVTGLVLTLIARRMISKADRARESA